MTTTNCLRCHQSIPNVWESEIRYGSIIICRACFLVCADQLQVWVNRSIDDCFSTDHGWTFWETGTMRASEIRQIVIDPSLCHQCGKEHP